MTIVIIEQLPVDRPVSCHAGAGQSSARVRSVAWGYHIVSAALLCHDSTVSAASKTENTENRRD